MSLTHHENGITHINCSRPGLPENRTHVLADLRVVVDAAIELQRITRESWPLDYPVPEEVQRINNFVDYAIARARGGALKNFGEMAND